MYAFLYRTVIFPFTKKSKIVSRKTFFNANFKIKLPAALDIYIYGTKSHPSEIWLAKFLINHLRPGNTFIDVGAHFGFFSSLASNLVGDNGKVISFEAAPRTFEILSLNTKRKNIAIYNNACSNKNEKLKFYEFPIDYSEYNALDKEQYNNRHWINEKVPKEVEVGAVKLEDVLDDSMIDVIKIDVEGAELQVLQGIEGLLKNKKVKYVIVEFIAVNQKEKLIVQLFENYQYFPFGISTNGFLKRIEDSDIDEYLEQIDIDSDNIVFKMLE